ncbi:hypothetical protein [Nibribacter koreensis]|uniref:DNA-binding protein n=1 Tax=Nibribacter koreensis TaxID=1084519 RepID=A0ABP8FB09_9BACT
MKSVTEYAAEIGKSRQAVQKQINMGKLNAKKVGGVWVILGKKADGDK